MNIELPKDAEGREIPLDTRKIFDKEGNEWYVIRVEYSPRSHEWRFAVSKDGSSRFFYEGYAHLEKPATSDSWEKLLDDLDNTAEKASSSVYIAPCCAWFSGGDRRCDDCPANESPGVSCNVQLVNDISARIRKLRGENE